jgi:hypothetical protein
MIGYINQTPQQMLKHLLNRGGALDFANTKELLAQQDGEWNINKTHKFTSTKRRKQLKASYKMESLPT